MLLLRASRGLPKHPRLMKVFSEPSNKKLVQQTESEYLRDQSRRMHEIDDELYYAIDEKNHQINLTEKGRDLLAPIVRRQGLLRPARSRDRIQRPRKRRVAVRRGDASSGRTS